MVRVALAVPLLALSVGFASAAPFWSAISTGCVPDAASIQGNRYQPAFDTAIRHRGGNLKRIVLICGVTPNTAGPLPEVLEMTYIDSTASGTKAYVRAELISVSRTTAVKVLVASVSSDGSGQTGITQQSSATFSHVMNFDNNYYFVRIEMDRATTAQNVRAIGVALDEAD
jgi:hypothetical protein